MQKKSLIKSRAAAKKALLATKKGKVTGKAGIGSGSVGRGSIARGAVAGGASMAGGGAVARRELAAAR